MPPPALRIPAIAVAVLLAGCSGEVSIGEKRVSGPEMADRITVDYERKTGIELPRLTCGSVDGEVGAAITCQGRNARDVALGIDGEITAVDDDGVDYRWDVTTADAPGAGYANAARRILTRRFGRLVEGVACPARVRVRVGTTVECRTRTTDGRTIPTTLRLQDLDGRFEMRTGPALGGGDDGDVTAGAPR